MSYCFATANKSRRFNVNGGFGLVELLVAIGIMVLVTTVVVVQQSGFNNVVLLENQAYELASDIRAVQVQALSVQNVNTSAASSTSYRQSLGVRVEVNDQRYEFVRESPDGGLFGTGGRLDRRFAITEIVAYDDSGATSTPPGDGVGIMFTRPNFDADFYEVVGSYDELPTDVSGVRISVQALEDDTRTRDVVVTSTGQVTVSNPDSP